MNPSVGVLRFPGTNCDRDVWRVLEELGHRPHWLWYKDSFSPESYGAFVIPGGFSYGDYLRSGALAALTPVMESLKKAVFMGKPVLGICNGFQILCESGLLPGTLMGNEKSLFLNRWVDLKLENKSHWGPQDLGSVYSMPIAHAEGRYFASESTYKKLKEKGQIWLTYRENPNGSLGDVAGVMDEKGLVAGLMPHPERAFWSWLEKAEGGRPFFNFRYGGGF